MVLSRSINWFESTSRSLSRRHPEVHPYVLLFVQRLTALFMDRIPSEMALKLLALLPPNYLSLDYFHRLKVSAISEADYSIGYIHFVERAVTTLSSTDFIQKYPSFNRDTQLRELCEKLADSYLWSISEEFPAEIKNDLIETLPSELKSRMSLFSGASNASQVA